MIISITTLLPNDKVQADAVDVGLAKITNVSNDLIFVVRVLYFLYFLFDLLILFLNYQILSSMLLMCLTKPF